MKKSIIISGLIVIVYSYIQSANFPFPQATTYPNGIKPTSHSQDTMNNDCQTAFSSWRTNYLTSNGAPAGTKRIQRSSADNYDTVSEGIGYGLIILVVMDNATNNTQPDFDAVFKYYKSYLNSRGLMHWRIDASGNVVGTNAATDAEVDVALALIFADKQWGSGGAINYLQEAKNIITNLMEWCVEKPSYVLKPGDVWGGSDCTNPSYYAPAFFRIFREVSGDTQWTNVINTCYNIINYFYTNYTTGLVPDWCQADGSPASGQSYHYRYDACRMPWRIGLDYLWYGTSNNALAYNNTKRVANWINNITGGDASRIRDGYTLSGSVLGTYNNAAFVGPFGVAAMCDATLQTWCNNLYSRLRAFSTGGAYGYYQDSLRLLTMLIMTGNFPNFYAAAPGPGNQAPNTPSQPSGPTSGNTGTSYSYSTSATDPDGDQVKYTFDWGDGTTTDTTFVNSGQTASASHSWSAAGTYQVRAKATDSKGASSGWSTVLSVNISYSPTSGKGKNYILTPNNDGINETVTFNTRNTIKIYNQTGKLLKTLNTPLWDGRDESGEVLKSGVYIYQILGNNKLTTGTITIVK